MPGVMKEAALPVFIFLFGVLRVFQSNAAPPVIISANCFDGRHVGVEFDQAIEPSSGTTPTNYVIEGIEKVSDGVDTSVAAVRLDSGGRIVFLRLSPEVLDPAFNLIVSGVRGLSGESGTTRYVTRVNNISAVRVGHSDVEPVEDGKVMNVCLGCFELILEGGRMGGVSDDLLFVGEPWDETPLLQDSFIDAPANTNSSAGAGVMIRESVDADSPFFALFVQKCPTAETNCLQLRAFWRKSRGEAVAELPVAPGTPVEFQVPKVRLSLFRDGGRVGASWNTNASDPWFPVSSVEFDQAFAGPVVAGIAGAYLENVAATPVRLTFSTGLLRGDFPPNPRLGFAFSDGRIRFSWSETSVWLYLLVESDLGFAPPSWKTVPIIPSVTNGTAAVSLAITEPMKFYALRLFRW